LLDSRIIGVAVGMAAVYLFYSLAVSQLTEVINGVLATRSRMLAAAIRDKLLGQHLGQKVLDSPIIQSLGFRKDAPPSYIPSEAFARAVVNIVADQNSPSTRDLIEHAQVPEALKHLLLSGEVGIEEAEARIARWYDDAMDRLSGAYRRHAQRWAFVVAAVLVLSTNADTVTLASRFWRDPVARQSEAALVTQCVDAHRDDGQASACQNQLIVSDLPIKWTRQEFVGVHGFGWLWLLFGKLVGLLATAAAVSLGAPFWFDLLGKLAPGLRMAGKPPKKAAAPVGK
jgi:hypothetical protein